MSHGRELKGLSEMEAPLVRGETQHHVVVESEEIRSADPSSVSMHPPEKTSEWDGLESSRSIRRDFRLMFHVLSLGGLGSLRRRRGNDGRLSRFPFISLLFTLVFWGSLWFWVLMISVSLYDYATSIYAVTPVGTWIPVTPGKDRFNTYIYPVYSAGIIGYYVAMFVLFVLKVWIWTSTALWRLCEPSNWDNVPGVPLKYTGKWYLKPWVWMILWVVLFVASMLSNSFFLNLLGTVWINYLWYACYSYTYLGTNLVIAFLLTDGLHMWVRVRDMCERVVESFESGDGVQAFDHFTAAIDDSVSYSSRWGCGGAQGVLSFYDILFLAQIFMSLYCAMISYAVPEMFISYFFFTFLPCTLAYAVPARLSSGELIKAAVRCQRLAGRSRDKTQLLEATNMQLLPKELKMLWGMPVTQTLLFGIASLMLAIVSFGLKNPLI